MRLRNVPLVLMLFFGAGLAIAEYPVADTTMVRAMRSHGFATLYAEARREGTLIGLPADEAGRLLFASATGLDEAERDALLLALLLRNRDDSPTRERLRAVVLRRIELVCEWSLIAELLSPPAIGSVEVETLRRVHLELARRLSLALEASPGGPDRSVAGYEPAAIALANSARELAEMHSATSLASDLVLAETFRAVGRLSRNPDVVAALNLAARELLR
ncbi:MAG: hypothetical protein ACOC2N_07115 [Spirochaetota bacterium]